MIFFRHLATPIGESRPLPLAGRHHHRADAEQGHQFRLAVEGRHGADAPHLGEAGDEHLACGAGDEVAPRVGAVLDEGVEGHATQRGMDLSSRAPKFWGNLECKMAQPGPANFFFKTRRRKKYVAKTSKITPAIYKGAF